MQTRSRIASVVLAAVLAVGGLAACSSGSSAVTEVTTSTASEVLAKPGMSVIDVRTPAEFAQGHIQGAVNIDVEDPAFATNIGKLPKDKPYFVYCRTGNRSGVATAKMADLGFTQIYDLQGGITEWQNAGGAVVFN
ncbi:rhodanese-like domain-containing protein [Cellulomonas sp. P24]|uniref:rhodanese-like domain-containing protein n=1 Tax=Cellulomonas sp. P24 TaxID=2885206 RepID=UPI00216AF688|nr:rhodanese-like domain-containing protein [Cellulomonas sp. P24]MCR6493830.1 rhodanese-like domain-containing protein [Cellulomonas sp. P24]